jgi:hypothetical protein
MLTFSLMPHASSAAAPWYFWIVLLAHGRQVVQIPEHRRIVEAIMLQLQVRRVLDRGINLPAAYLPRTLPALSLKYAINSSHTLEVRNIPGGDKGVVSPSLDFSPWRPVLPRIESCAQVAFRPKKSVVVVSTR